jgi:stress-induced morphogen
MPLGDNRYVLRLIVQITEALKPSALEIYNDSNKHAHHKAMAGVTSREVCMPSFALRTELTIIDTLPV